MGYGRYLTLSRSRSPHPPPPLNIMAILSGGLLGSSRNKVGSIVTFRLKGQDVARSLAASVANPRTAAQQTQRVKLANLVAMYRANRPWMERLAFESRPQKWSVYNAFVSANINDNTVYLTKPQAARGDCIVAPYKVTDGTLPSIVIQSYGLMAGSFKTNLYVGTVNPETATVAEITTALLANNNGLSEGMQLSLIVNYQQQQNGQYSNIVRYFECILSTADESNFIDRMGNERVRLVDGSIGYLGPDNGAVVGFTFVLSKDEANKTRVSTQYLVMTDNSLVRSFGTPAQLANARDSYGSTDAPFLAGGYQEGSNGLVDMPLSILSAHIRDRNDVQVGGYLGTSSTEDSFTVTVNLNQETDLTVSRFRLTLEDAETNDATSSTVNETAITGTFAADSQNPTKAVTVIEVLLSDGTELTATFDDGGGSLDVTE